ncbi:hypothetical protein Tco_0968170 [Tanacetum coccineum]
MEQMTTLCDFWLVQAKQKEEEEKRIAEEQAAIDRYWKIPICYDDDEDDTIAITPILPIEEPDNSLSMGDEHLDTIPATESDEVIKSSVEDLVLIPSESKGIPDKNALMWLFVKIPHIGISLMSLHQLPMLNRQLRGGEIVTRKTERMDDDNFFQQSKTIRLR